MDADPLDEEAHRARMQALYLAGDTAAALAAYQRLRDALVEDLGADPGPETEALYLAILRSEPVEAPRPGTPAPRPADSSPLVGREA